MNEEKSKFISISKAALYTGFSAQTLRTFADDKKIPSFKTPSGQRRFNIEDLEKMCNTRDISKEIKQVSRKNFIYTRVSSKKQMDDLSRQINYLQCYNNGMYSTYNVLSDIGSGINFKRKGFDTILETCL